MKLEISLFKFDCKSDYLPYYKKYFMNITKDMTLYELLKLINEEDEFSFDNTTDSSLVINGKYVDVTITCEEITKSFGKDITIEPLSTKRAYSDLLIDDKDFIDSLKLFEDFISIDEIKNISELKKYYYSSNSFNHNREYIGDAALFLAYDLIHADSSNREKILEIISDEESGITYHTNLQNRVYNYDVANEEKVLYLKKQLNKYLPVEKQNYRTNNTFIIKFDETKEEEIKHSFKEFSIGYFYGDNRCSDTDSFINQLEAKKIDLNSQDNDIAMQSYHEDEDFAISLASEVMIEAYDKNCDFLVVDNDQTFYMLDYNRKAAEKISGREILIPILHISELKNLAYGNFDIVKESFSKHTLVPQMI